MTVLTTIIFGSIATVLIFMIYCLWILRDFAREVAGTEDLFSRGRQSSALDKKAPEARGSSGVASGQAGH